MDKEEAIKEFLKGLRIALNNASAYFREHPYFIKSVENFKQKVDQLFAFLSPIVVNITPHSLFVDNKCWEKGPLYVELASTFHLRKIKSIWFKEGLTSEELADFLSRVSGPIKEILRQGGIQNILSKEKGAHLTVEELDYSQFLKEGAGEAKDIWVYLFRKSVENDDLDKINEVADNFEGIIKNFKASDLLEDSELRHNLYNFLICLKDTQKDKFNSCTKGLLSFLLKDKALLKEKNLDEIRLFFKDLDVKDLSQELWREITQEDKFDALSLAVFSHIFTEDTDKSIAAEIQEKINKKQPLNITLGKRKKIKELLFSSEDQLIPSFYRNILTFLLQDGASSKELTFDSELINSNYRSILLNLLALENGKELLALISQRLSKECVGIFAERDIEYLKLVLDILNKKIKDQPLLAALFGELENSISSFLENELFENEGALDLEYLIDSLRKSSMGAEFYLDKIFNQNKVNRPALKFWLKFFPGEMPLFYSNLKAKSYDLGLISKIINGLSRIDSSLSAESLKKIFYFSNNIIKLEVLRTMQNLKCRDSEFLYSILKDGSVFLKKEALRILTDDDLSRSLALERFFSVSSPWWAKNRVIIENIMLVDSIGLKEAEGYLIKLTKKKYFWNKKIRNKAQEVLEKWHDGKD